MLEIESLAFRFFGGVVLKTQKKDLMVAELRGLVVKAQIANPMGLSPESIARAMVGTVAVVSAFPPSDQDEQVYSDSDD